MTIRIGVIAEDTSDVDVFETIARKISNKELVIRKFVGHGCGKLRKECFQWARNLKEQNCSILVLIHDLDNSVLADLKNLLQGSLNPSPIKNNIIVIPVREIEAWLLSDENAIRLAMNIKVAISPIANPESIDKPKEHLGRLVEKKSLGTKHYLNTVHNKKIASCLNVEKVRKCKSFLPLETFLAQYL